MTILSQKYALLHPDTRKSMVQALILFRNKKLIDQVELLKLFLSLLKCRDKILRSMLLQYIISDLKLSNQKTKNQKLNKILQNEMFDLIISDNMSTNTTTTTGNTSSINGEGGDIAAKYCLDICISLYKRNIWNDSKTVNLIASACFSQSNKIMVTALKFFLGILSSSSLHDGDGDDGEDSDSRPDMQKLQFQAVITKKSKNRQARLKRALKSLKKRSGNNGTNNDDDEEDNEADSSHDLSALYLINDPQGFAEKLFSRLSRTETETESVKISRDLKFEIRLLIMNLVSRVISVHRLIILGYYSYVIRYLKPHQSEITNILAYCAQASHDLVPPDAINKLIHVLIDNFVTESFSSEVIACGINSIREIGRRCPLSLDKESALYISTFKDHRDKGTRDLS